MPHLLHLYKSHDTVAPTVIRFGELNGGVAEEGHLVEVRRKKKPDRGEIESS